jgi:hypothetical protein
MNIRNKSFPSEFTKGLFHYSITNVMGLLKRKKILLNFNRVLTLVFNKSCNFSEKKVAAYWLINSVHNAQYACLCGGTVLFITEKRLKQSQFDSFKELLFYLVICYIDKKDWW